MNYLIFALNPGDLQRERVERGIFQRSTEGRDFLRFDADFQSNSGDKITHSSTGRELVREPLPSAAAYGKTLSTGGYVHV